MSPQPRTVPELRDAIVRAIADIDALTATRKIEGRSVPGSQFPDALDKAQARLLGIFDEICAAADDPRPIGGARLAIVDALHYRDEDGGAVPMAQFRQSLQMTRENIAALHKRTPDDRHTALRGSYMGILKRVRRSLDNAAGLEMEDPARAAGILRRIDAAARATRETALECAQDLSSAGIASSHLGLLRDVLRARYGEDFFSLLEDAVSVAPYPEHTARFLSGDHLDRTELNAWIAGLAGVTPADLPADEAPEAPSMA